MAFSPWLMALAEQTHRVVSGGFWIPPLTPRMLLSYVWAMMRPGFVAVPLLFLFALWGGRWRGITFFDAMGAFVFLGTVAVGVVLSWAVLPIFIPRYAVPSFMCMCISLLYMFRRLGARAMLLFACMLVLGSAVSDGHHVKRFAKHWRDTGSLNTLLGDTEQGATFVFTPVFTPSLQSWAFQQHNATVLSTRTTGEVLYVTTPQLYPTYNAERNPFPNLHAFVQEQEREMWEYLRNVGGTAYLVSSGHSGEAVPTALRHHARIEMVGGYTIELPCVVYKLTLPAER